MHRRGLVQPHMTVYAGSLVEPTLFESGVGPDAYEVLSSIVEVFGYIISPCGISAWLTSEVESVHPYARVAEYSVELEPDMLPVILLRNCEGLPVPADACLRVFVSHCLVSVAVACLFGIRKVHHPVVREVHHGPSAGIELRGVWPFVVDRGGFCKVVEVFGPASEILCRG